MVKLSVVVRSNKLPVIGGALRGKASQLVRATAFAVETGAKQRSPVDTGFLRNSIQTQTVNDLTAEVTVGADYGVHQEYGTRYQPAQPYLTPAADAARPAFEAGARQLVEG